MSGLPNLPPRWPPSSLLQYLPAIYAEAPFLGQFLLAFEELLFGRDEDGVRLDETSPAPLDRLIADLATRFDPLAAPADFLPWLASWTAFTLRFDLNDRQQREFIAKVIPLYRWRGTKSSLEDLLTIFTNTTATVTEAATIEHPHFFRVTVTLPPGLREHPEIVLRQIAIAYAIVELAKPAHTEFALEPVFPSMQIGVHSKVGVDTLLGTLPRPGESA